MKLGELVDKIRALEQAERDVSDAKLAIQHGGCEATMKSKYAILDIAECWLNAMREQYIEISE